MTPFQIRGTDMQKQMGLTEARGKLSEIVNEVLYKQDTYIITKQGKPVVAVVPLKVLKEWQSVSKPKRRKKLADAIEMLRKETSVFPAAQMEDEEFMDTVTDLVNEVRAKNDS